MLKIEGLDVAIGSVSILRNVSMELPPGKFTGLIGRNGAGKTTLMRSIMGILKPRNGSVHFEGGTLDATRQALLDGQAAQQSDRPPQCVAERLVTPDVPAVSARREKVADGRTITEDDRQTGSHRLLDGDGGL